MTISDGQNIDKPINQEPCLSAQLSLPQQFTLPQTVPQAACPSPALSSRLSWTRPQDTWTFLYGALQRRLSQDSHTMSKAFCLAVRTSSTPVAMPLGSFLTTSMSSARDMNKPSPKSSTLPLAKRTCLHGSHLSPGTSPEKNRLQLFSRSLVPQPEPYVELSPSIPSWYCSTSCTTFRSFGQRQARPVSCHWPPPGLQLTQP